jgi:hypothetical protein
MHRYRCGRKTARNNVMIVLLKKFVLLLIQVNRIRINNLTVGYWARDYGVGRFIEKLFDDFT